MSREVYVYNRHISGSNRWTVVIKGKSGTNSGKARRNILGQGKAWTLHWIARRLMRNRMGTGRGPRTCMGVLGGRIGLGKISFPSKNWGFILLIIIYNYWVWWLLRKCFNSWCCLSYFALLSRPVTLGNSAYGSQVRQREHQWHCKALYVRYNRYWDIGPERNSSSHPQEKDVSVEGERGFHAGTELALYHSWQTSEGGTIAAIQSLGLESGRNSAVRLATWPS